MSGVEAFAETARDMREPDFGLGASRQQATVDGDGAAGRESTRWHCEIQHGVGDFRGLARPIQNGVAAEILLARITLNFCRHGRIDRAGADRIDGDAFASKLNR